MPFFRHRMLRKYYDQDIPADAGWHFSQLPPQEYHRELEQSENDQQGIRDKLLIPKLRQAQLFTSWSIAVTHEITEEAFGEQSVYSLPIKQYIFTP